MLTIEGAVVTVNAMGCQCAIAQKIIDKKADYVLALKGNQSSLHDDVKLFAAKQKQVGFKNTAISRAEAADGRPRPYRDKDRHGFPRYRMVA